MKTIPLQLRYTEAAVRAPLAWLIPGGSARAWLEEICFWRTPQAAHRIYILPASARDLSPAAALVVPGSNSAPKRVLRALPYGAVVESLYLPVEAEIFPPMQSGEMDRRHAVQVFHPTLGLVGFSESDALSVADLLNRAKAAETHWNSARAAAPFRPRLAGLRIDLPPSLEALFGDAGGEIGAEPIEDLPATPDEPREDKSANAWRTARKGMLDSLQWALSRFPHTGSRRTWINDAEDWAANQKSRLEGDLTALRFKEISRLLHQLKNDPEQGLRHAIPMSHFPHRGIAPPGARLGNRTPDFNLEKIGGGHAADFWALPDDMQRELSRRYRELANIELQAGRCRRAAYIFAELLGDLSSSAAALKQGRHFVEAAAVYRDHLKLPLEAAACLAEAGLFAEAVAIYEKESRFLEAGDLYLKLGQRDSAHAAFRRETGRLLSHEDRTGAAKILEERLESPDEALAVLAEGWPHSAQAFQCLQAQFALSSRLGRHAIASGIIAKLREENLPPEKADQLVELLATQAISYPDTAVRRTAADVARTKAGERLRTSTPAETVRLCDAIVRLEPGDRLVARDAIRFTVRRNEEFRQRLRPPPAQKSTAAPILTKKFDLPLNYQWRAFRSTGSCFYAIGNRKSEFTAVRGNWDEAFQTVVWSKTVIIGRPVLEVDETATRPPLLVVKSTPLIAYRETLTELAFRSTDHFVWTQAAVTPEWLPSDAKAICVRDQLAWILRKTNASYVLECRRCDGVLVNNRELRDIGTVDTPFPSLLIQGDQIWIAVECDLYLIDSKGVAKSWKFESKILSLTSSPPHLPRCVVIGLERGAVVHRVDHRGETSEVIAPDMEEPLAAFTASGTLILLSKTEGRLCEPARSGTITNTFDWPGAEPVGLVRARGANEFAIFTKDGKGHLFRVESRQV